MKIKYLGTAAAEGIPAMFCQCELCKKARKLGGKNIRTRAQAIVNDKILLDFGPDTYMHTLKYGIDLSVIRHCLITHTHEDHFYPGDFDYLHYPFAHTKEGTPKFNIYGGCDIFNFKADILVHLKDCAEFHVLEAFKTVKIDDIEVTPLEARHNTNNPLIYILSCGGKTMLYAHDTGIFPDSTWQYLEKADLMFDLVSFDCTEGNHENMPYSNHMCIGRNKQCRERLIKLGVANKNTKFIINHFSHNGKDNLYDDMSVIAEKQGFTASFDGMEIEF